jgi:hypothetical protein
MSKDPELTAMSAAHDALAGLDPEKQRRVLVWLAQKLDLSGAGPTTQPGSPILTPQLSPSSASGTLGSPKQFVAQKRPTTDTERVAVLAYFLTNARSTNEFKTKDISAVNKEAAQRAFSNSPYAVDNATKSGYLAPASKGAKQITTRGEALVDALPERARVQAALDENPIGGRRRGGPRARRKKAPAKA